MTILSATELWAGQTSDDEESGARSYERVFQVISDTPTESPIIVKSVLPQINAPFPGDAEAVVTSRSVSRDSSTREVWEGTVTYEFNPEDPEEAVDDPRDEPAKIRWSSSLEIEPIVKDRSGKAIVNSAGDYFDPPIEWPVAKWQANVQKNVGSVPFDILGWAGAINTAPYTLDGVTVEAKKSRLVAIEIGETQRKKIEVEGVTSVIVYRSLTLSIEFSEEEYKIRPLDQGFRTNDGSGHKDILIEDEDGNKQRPSSPVLLNGSGGKLLEPNETTAVFLEFDPPKTPEIDFTVLPLT